MVVCRVRERLSSGTTSIIRQNLGGIKRANWIIDMGPEGGRGGGLLLAAAPPGLIASTPASFTGHYLKAKLHPRARG